jgi:hypothetical protein
LQQTQHSNTQLNHVDHHQILPGSTWKRAAFQIVPSPIKKNLRQEFDASENSRPDHKVQHQKTVPHLSAAAFGAARDAAVKIRSDGAPFRDLHDARLANCSLRF